METKTLRRFMLHQKWEELNKKELISIDHLFELMDQVHKLLMSYDQAIESRDRWKKKYEGIKNRK